MRSPHLPWGERLCFLTAGGGWDLQDRGPPGKAVGRRGWGGLARWSPPETGAGPAPSAGHTNDKYLCQTCQINPLNFQWVPRFLQLLL